MIKRSTELDSYWTGHTQQPSMEDPSNLDLTPDPRAPPPADLFHYDQMIRRIQSTYEGRFANLLT